MTNGQQYLQSVETISKVKREYEHVLIDHILHALASTNYYSKKENSEPYSHEDTVTLTESIKIHCPRGYNKDVEITKLHWETNNITLFYCSDDDKFTKFDFGAEDFIDMCYKIIKDNFE